MYYELNWQWIVSSSHALVAIYIACLIEFLVNSDPRDVNGGGLCNGNTIE